MGGGNILDTRLFYTGQEANDFFKNLSPSEELSYRYIALIDLMLYIPCYTLILFQFASRAGITGNKVFVSFIPAFFDVVETLTIFLYLNARMQAFPSWVGFFTCTKWLSVFAVVIYIGANLMKNPRRLN
jgi:hypothetical protein